MNNQSLVLPVEIIEHIFNLLPYQQGSWFNVLTSCKLFNTIGRRVFDPSRDTNKVMNCIR